MSLWEPRKSFDQSVRPDGVGRDEPAGPVGGVILQAPDTTGTATPDQEHQADGGSWKSTC